MKYETQDVQQTKIENSFQSPREKRNLEYQEKGRKWVLIFRYAFFH